MLSRWRVRRAEKLTRAGLQVGVGTSTKSGSVQSTMINPYILYTIGRLGRFAESVFEFGRPIDLQCPNHKS
jgi:hypothetical protein